MAKLTKAQLKNHLEAERILTQDKLSDDERDFVFENWNEAANFTVGEAGAFFTPQGLAADLVNISLAPTSGRVIDLCAGIGGLARWVAMRGRYGNHKVSEIVCVEINPTYCEIGKKLVPEARWICADIFDWRALELGRFDYAVSNPPFGRVRTAKVPCPVRYKGAYTEFHIIDIAAEITDGFGAFLLPLESASFRLSHAQYYERKTDGRGVDFERLTGLHMDNDGIDTRYYDNRFKNTKICVEAVGIDFQVWREEKQCFNFRPSNRGFHKEPVQASLF